MVTRNKNMCFSLKGYSNIIYPLLTHTDIEKYYSVDDYEAEEEDEISFPKGAIVDVLQKRLDGWWFVKHEDKTGLAPATFLRKGQPPMKPDLVRTVDKTEWVQPFIYLTPSLSHFISIHAATHSRDKG